MFTQRRCPVFHHLHEPLSLFWFRWVTDVVANPLPRNYTHGGHDDLALRINDEDERDTRAPRTHTTKPEQKLGAARIVFACVSRYLFSNCQRSYYEVLVENTADSLVGQKSIKLPARWAPGRLEDQQEILLLSTGFRLGISQNLVCIWVASLRPKPSRTGRQPPSQQ
jgi:hypothetical protein